MNLQLLCLLSFVLGAKSAHALALSTCQKQQALYEGPDSLDVRCTPNGDYSPFQCFPRSGLCYCATASGRQVTHPSRLRKNCRCELMKHEVLNSLKVEASGQTIDSPKGTWIPSCEENGLFSSKQCEVGTEICWCVDPKEGDQVSERQVNTVCD